MRDNVLIIANDVYSYMSALIIKSIYNKANYFIINENIKLENEFILTKNLTQFNKLTNINKIELTLECEGIPKHFQNYQIINNDLINYSFDVINLIDDVPSHAILHGVYTTPNPITRKTQNKNILTIDNFNEIFISEEKLYYYLLKKINYSHINIDKNPTSKNNKFVLNNYDENYLQLNATDKFGFMIEYSKYIGHSLQDYFNGFDITKNLSRIKKGLLKNIKKYNHFKESKKDKLFNIWKTRLPSKNLDTEIFLFPLYKDYDFIIIGLKNNFYNKNDIFNFIKQCNVKIKKIPNLNEYIVYKNMEEFNKLCYDYLYNRYCTNPDNLIEGELNYYVFNNYYEDTINIIDTNFIKNN